ncbi:hypothetical protein [Tistrella mobilis]|jgi:hypothetical protein|uniref:Uncharacterized protein n=1 Tax=Tistrella mobilis (strain KA081020-065) TaxID=1110502 RepID=I3TGK0_TISMK|nr:hypothetical protein [Tistrella mobilis]AFK51888.1 hypothetical protein TMO_0049 [Tistrella mobilis KA081020-065]
MAFSLKRLNAIGGQSASTYMASGAVVKGGPMVHSYVSEDPLATVRASGYFNDAFGLFNLGDWIFVTTITGGAVTAAGIMIVNSVNAATRVIDVTDATAMTVTDTD